MQKSGLGPEIVASWQDLAHRAAEQFGTPLFLCRHNFVAEQATRLQREASGIVLRQWLAVKAHPVRELLLNWKSIGYGVEVVSPFELEAALEAGFPPDRILVNGVGKHAWLGRYSLSQLRVHLDSIAEIEALAEHAALNSWSLGFRYHPTTESDPDEPEFEDQFGIDAEELLAIIPVIRRRGIRLHGVHFHLRSNVRSIDDFRHGIEESIEACHRLGFMPSYVDCGGGLPADGETPALNPDGVSGIDIRKYSQMLQEIPARWPSVQEVWVENGRYISSTSAALVVRVLDVKERNRSRYLICDGGRTNQALVSDWQSHTILHPADRQGPTCLTTICGPTCMAYDRLARVQLPRSVQSGDLLIWMNAGAYHIPWENRFSFGLASVIAVDADNSLREIRRRDSFSDWWGAWNKDSKL